MFTKNPPRTNKGKILIGSKAIATSTLGTIIDVNTP